MKANLKEIETLDFDALLLATKAKHLQVTKGEVTHQEYDSWCKANIFDKGIQIETNQFTGEPMHLLIELV